MSRDSASAGQELADDAERAACAPSRSVDDNLGRAARREERPRRRPGRHAQPHRERSAPRRRPSGRRSPRCACARSSARRRRRPAIRAPASAARRSSATKRVPSSNSRTSRCPCRRLWLSESTMPGRSDGRSTANVSESGLAIATLVAGRAELVGRSLADERERHALVEAGGRCQPPQRAVLLRAARRVEPAPSATGGNVVGSRS